MADTLQVIGVDGKVHNVPAERIHEFRHDSDGSALTDAEYDEHQARLAQNNDYLVPKEFR